MWSWVFLLILLLLSHFIADFLLQSREMAKEKSNNLGVLIKHCLIQFTIPLIILSCFAQSWLIVIVCILNAVIHGIIDWNIWGLYKSTVLWRSTSYSEEDLAKWKYWEDHWFYVTIGLDQLLHTLTIVFLWFFFLPLVY